LRSLTKFDFWRNGFGALQPARRRSARQGEPTKVHHLDRDPEFLIELPESIQIHRIVVDRQGLR
jgi:hypothetical protein